jgi:hypothetical protein
MLNSWGSSTWVTPVVQLLEARAPPSLGSYFWFTPETLVGLENSLSPSITAFRQIHKLRLLSPPPKPHLETLARTFQMDERGYLARSLLASLGRTSGDLAHQVDLEFQPGAFYDTLDLYTYPTVLEREQRKARASEILRFRGSILEFYAHLSTSAWTHKGLHEILEFAAGHFDPSTVMLFVIANHQHRDNGPGSQCWGCLVLTHLLQLGAKATAPGYAVGSLQVAVARRDAAAVSLLLDAGLDANDIGDPCGDIGTPERGPMFGWFRSIRGRSPLNIVKQRQFVALETTNLWHKKHKLAEPGRLAAILIQHGARDFTFSSDQDSSLATDMGMIGISEDGGDVVSSKNITVSS